MYICLNVICKRDRSEKEKIYYLLGKTCLMFNGCDNLCGSKDCIDCGKSHYEEAKEIFMKLSEPYVLIDNKN